VPDPALLKTTVSPLLGLAGKVIVVALLEVWTICSPAERLSDALFICQAPYTPAPAAAQLKTPEPLVLSK
jgi:hypothetical protein